LQLAASSGAQSIPTSTRTEHSRATLFGCGEHAPLEFLTLEPTVARPVSPGRAKAPKRQTTRVISARRSPSRSRQGPGTGTATDAKPAEGTSRPHTYVPISRTRRNAHSCSMFGDRCGVSLTTCRPSAECVAISFPLLI
jgi:hypothetical protein